MSPRIYYTSVLSEKQKELETITKKIRHLSSLRLVLAIGILIALYFSIAWDVEGLWVLPLLMAGIFLAVIKLHTKWNAKRALLQIHLGIVKNELDALDGSHTPFLPGSEFIDVLHPYSFDLDIFGPRSVYQMLCRTVTVDGAAALAELLKKPYDRAEGILNRQEILRELSAVPAFLEDFRMAGQLFDEKKGDLSKVKAWLEKPEDLLKNKFITIATVLVPLFTLTLLVLSYMQQRVHPLLSLVVIFNWILLGSHSGKIKETAGLLAKNIRLIDKFEALHSVVSKQHFNNSMLSHIAAEASSSVAAISKFRKLVHLFETRYNGMVGPLMNTLFLFDFYCMMRLEQWRKKSRSVMMQSFDDLIYLDVCVSLATYAFNHPDHIYPVIDKDQKIMTGREVIHPLLSDAKAVGNDFTLGRDEQFYLLTGANMTGKSTFIRTIGLNLVFSYAGLPVRAQFLSVPLVRLYTAIRISDSVQEDISYFKAELNRVKCIMEEISSSDETYLVLLDEPLRGTNTNDKQNGTRAIIRKLAGYKTMGVVATHDTVLCQLAQEHPAAIANYHFESSVEGNALNFDYRLKPGCSVSNNATILMEQLGII